MQRPHGWLLVSAALVLLVGLTVTSVSWAKAQEETPEAEVIEESGRR